VLSDQTGYGPPSSAVLDRDQHNGPPPPEQAGSWTRVSFDAGTCSSKGPSKSVTGHAFLIWTARPRRTSTRSAWPWRPACHPQSSTPPHLRAQIGRGRSFPQTPAHDGFCALQTGSQPRQRYRELGPVPDGTCDLVHRGWRWQAGMNSASGYCLGHQRVIHLIAASWLCRRFALPIRQGHASDTHVSARDNQTPGPRAACVRRSQFGWV